MRRDLIEQVWFDFHAECKGGDQGYFGAVFSPLIKKEKDIDARSSSKHPYQDEYVMHSRPSWGMQDGVVRTNCMDCLERTNVVQSMFGRYMIYYHIHKKNGRLLHRRRTLPLVCMVAYKRRPL